MIFFILAWFLKLINDHLLPKSLKIWTKMSHKLFVVDQSIISQAYISHIDIYLLTFTNILFTFRLYTSA